MAVFAIGTAIGGGVVVDGVLRLEPLGAAGELGHQTVAPDGASCGCGSRGCLETVTSGPAIRAEGVRLIASGLAPRLAGITGGDLRRVTPETMAAAAAAGDELVAQAIERAARWLGIGVANVITVLHPELVVLAGGVGDLDGLIRVRRLGATRCGATATTAMLDEFRRREAAGEPIERESSQIGGGSY